ncbi:MAG: DUF4147 domain-containing protein [Clostridia bacterium]|nr:DUF4147 domain-containing protein [Clostridia bacterium]
MSLKADALDIAAWAVKAADPYETTCEALKKYLPWDGAFTVFSIGKAAIPMAKAAADTLGGRIKTGLAVAKYGHTGDFSSPYFQVIEAAHPVSDENSVRAAETALAVADGLNENDTAVVLLSGGGSALFEKSLIPPEAQRELTQKLLSRGAEITEINAVRRRVSAVKGGKFAARCYPARVVTFALSDVLGDDRSVIASGITVKDETPDGFVKAVADKYLFDIDNAITEKLFHKEDLTISDGGYHFVGNIDLLCGAAKARAEALGYEARIVSKALTGEAREQAKRILAAMPERSGKRAYLYGGETTVTLTGNGLGGRNQEMALAAAIALKGREGIAFCSVGSDGTDGPTDAAGGFADGAAYEKMTAAGVSPEAALADNDSYRALKACGDLIVTGPTGTNVNDLTFVLTDEP